MGDTEEHKIIKGFECDAKDSGSHVLKSSNSSNVKKGLEAMAVRKSNEGLKYDLGAKIEAGSLCSEER